MLFGALFALLLSGLVISKTSVANQRNSGCRDRTIIARHSPILLLFFITFIVIWCFIIFETIILFYSFGARGEIFTIKVGY